VGAMITPSIRLARRLGAGGMGAVWVAEPLALDYEGGVKFMSSELATPPESVARFAREAAAASQVKSPHVVQMLDHGMSDEGVPFIVMEHLEGHHLADEIDERGALEPTKVVAVVVQ